MSTGEVSSDLLSLTVDITAAYVSHNSLSFRDLPELMFGIHNRLSGLKTSSVPEEPPAPPQQPAVNPKRSVHKEYLVCLEDGRKFKSLRRHLMASYGMTPEDYRRKWNLPADYPMVAPSYAQVRSALAKSSGLGKK